MRPVIFWALVLVTLFGGPAAWAEALSTLSTGMTQNEVIRAWGAPKEKIERESARTESWIYPAGQVHFKEGLLSSWDPAGAEPVIVLAETAPVKEPEQFKGNNPEQAEVDEILSELMKAGSGDVPTSAGSPPRPPMPGNMPPQLFKQP